MLKLSDFPSFIPNIEGISIDNVTRWLNKPNNVILQNKVSNRLIYPSVVAQDLEQMDIDLAILREKLKLEVGKYFNPASSKIIIPENLSQKYPDWIKLTLAFTDAFRPFGVTSLILTSDKLAFKNLGTFIRPQLVSTSGTVSLTVQNKKTDIKIGSLVVFPAKGLKADIIFDSKVAKLLGNNHLVEEVAAGPVGIILDTRG